jgi:hypothetical protein
MPNKRGTGLMMVWCDVPAEAEEEFNHWYNTEHLQELLSVPGVLNAARYEATSSGPKHLAMYELESVAVVDTDAFKNRPPTPWGQKAGPRAVATTLINNVYEMIHPTGLSDELANADMSPALQIGRMDVPAEADAEWNNWYSTVYVPNYEKVDGCTRGRRWKAVRGEPSYATVYEFANPEVSSTAPWLEQRDIHPDNVRMREVMTHAAGSPGIWRKTFQI